MKTGTYHGGAFDPALLNNPCIVLEEGKEITLADGKTKVEVAKLLVFQTDGTSVVRDNVQHEDDKIEAKDEKGEKCHHAHYELD